VSVNVVVVGHVDHGKSTLIGRLLYDSETLPEDRLAEVQKLLEEYKRRFEFAYFLDSFQEELEEERTIDTTRVLFKGRDYYTVVDVPGHKEFIKNMLTGACHAQAAVLVVSAPEGVQEQTGRHSFLIHMLGIRQVLVVVNKMDAVDYEQSPFEQVKEDTARLLASLGYTGLTFIPGSALEGDNIYKPSANMPWYRGPTLIQALDALEPEQVAEKALRLVVQDVYPRAPDKLTVGRVEAGTLSRGDRLVFQPSGATGTVERILVYPGEVEKAYSGDCVGLEVAAEPRRGDVAGPVGSTPAVTEAFTGEVVLLEGTLTTGDVFEIKCATARVPARVREIRQRLSSETGALMEGDSGVINENEAAVVVFDTEPLALEAFSETPQLGRFVLVREGRNTGAGLVLDVSG